MEESYIAKSTTTQCISITNYNNRFNVLVLKLFGTRRPLFIEIFPRHPKSDRGSKCYSTGKAQVFIKKCLLKTKLKL